MRTTATASLSLRPSLALFGTEPLRAALEYASHRLRPRAAVAQGDGHPVIIFPGLGADGHAVATLRDHARTLGYAATDWGRGFNTGPRGDVDAWIGALAAEVERQIDASGEPATLIGWSLGGIYARELGKLLGPRRVRQVITIGTPFNADADHSNVGWLFRLLNGSSATIDAAMAQRLRTPPPVPTTSIYSRSDGIVAWQTCCHARRGSRVEDIEVTSSHVGMVWNSDVLNVVADRLAQPAGRWRRYAASPR